MENENNLEKRRDILFLVLLLIFIILIGLFNYIIDPYYIFRDSTIKGINNVKTHKYSNKRTIIYSDIKINSNNKDTAFTGNCLLSHYGSGLDNVAFFTVPVAKVEEVSNIIKNIHKIAPEIKTIYWGLFYDDFWNDKNDEVNDTLPILETKKINLDDIINLFFSYNTTKYSIETLRDSIKNKGQDIIYVYPYREIAKKTYNKKFSFDSLNNIKEIKEFADQNNIKLIIYYSPIHISKKVHIYSKGLWDSNQELKRKLAEITPFYDYSFQNEYNMSPLDEYNMNFIDNIHPSNTYNNLIVFDLLSNTKKIGTYITKENIENYIKIDNENLKNYIKENPQISEKIKNVKKEDADISVRRKNAV